MHVPMISGRSFRDDEAAVVINKSMAAKFWPDGNALGARIKMAQSVESVEAARWLTIVGIAGDERAYPGMGMSPTIYSGCTLCNFLLVKTRGPSITLVDNVRREFAEADKMILITKAKTVADSVSRAGPIVDSRFLASLSFAFAGTALLLAFAGVYGLAAYAAEQRFREMGIRVALGATRRDVLRIMMQQCVVPSATGIVLGLIGASMLSTLMKAYLFEVDPSGKAPLILVSALLISVAMLANFIPALRATRIDPMAALRQE